MTPEITRIPEAVAAKPKTLLKQITETLTPHTKGEKPYLFIARVVDPMCWAEIYLSPANETFDPKELNKFRDNLLAILRTGIEDHDLKLESVKDAERLLKSDSIYPEGTLTFPSIKYGSEIIGERVTTDHYFISDTLYSNKKAPKKREDIFRSNTVILIYPSPKVARLASAARKQQRLPREFSGQRIIWGITEEQVKALPQVGLKPSSSKLGPHSS